MIDVLMLPGGTINPYVGSIADGLRRQGLSVSSYRPFNPFQDTRVLHVHWFESIMFGGLVRRSGLAGEFAFVNLWRTVKRIKARGGRLVWTAHNLCPHEREPGHIGDLLETWIPRLNQEIDLVISLSEVARAGVARTFPEIKAPVTVIPHQNYKGVYPAAAPRSVVRETLGIPSMARVIGMIGLMRPYKAILETIELFERFSRPQDYLLIAGACFDDKLAREIDAAVAGQDRVIVIRRVLSEQEIADYHAAVDLIFCGQRNIVNSGSVLAALSLDRPVVAYEVGSLPEIRNIVGREWCHLIDPALPMESLFSALDSLSIPPIGSFPDISDLDIDQIVALHQNAYLGLLNSP